MLPQKSGQPLRPITPPHHCARPTADCWQKRQYVYDGERFVKSADIRHGLCRGFTGGPWEMAIYRSDVQPPIRELKP